MSFSFLVWIDLPQKIRGIKKRRKKDVWANTCSRIINIIVNSGFIFYCSKKKEVTKKILNFKNYIYIYSGLGTDALNTRSKLEKKVGISFFKLKMPPLKFKLKCSIAS